jgi:hypothetical protein
MLRLSLIVQNPTAETAITWIGVIILGVLAASLVFLWIFVVRAGTHRESSEDPALDVLRHRKLVPRRSGTPAGPQATEVVELEPDSESEPTAS